MAIILGSASTTAFSSTVSINSTIDANKVYYSSNKANAFTATATATAENLHLYINDWLTQTSIKVVLFDETAGAGTVLESVIVPAVAGAGEITVALSGTVTLTSGSPYRVGIFTPDENDISLFSDPAAAVPYMRASTSGGDYTTPTAAINDGSWEGNNAYYFAIDDVSGGGGYTVTTEADVAPGETITLTHNLGTLTGAKLIAGTSEQALSLTGNNATAPALSNGLPMVPFGTVTLEATDGTNTATTSIDYAGNASIGVTTLATGFTTGVGTASENFTGDPQVVGDQYVYPSANNFSITDQNIPQADSSQTVTAYSLDVSDAQILAEAFDVSYTEATADTTPDSYSYTSTTGNALSSTSTSNTITVAGVDAATDIPLTLTGAGTYEISTDSGATWGTPGTAATNVQLGHQIRLTHTNSAGYSTPTSTSTSIGGTSGTFTTLTIPDPAAVTGDGLVKTMQAVSFKTETLTATNIKAKTL